MSIRKQNTKIIVHNSKTELILDNYLDRNVKSMLLAFVTIQTVMLVPKFRIKNNIITPNDTLFKLLLCIGIAIYIFGNVYQLYHISDEDLQQFSLIQIQDFVLYSNYFSNIIGFFVYFIIILVQSKSNVQFIINFQTVFRFLYNDVIDKKYVRRNWISIVIIVSFYILFVIYNCLMYRDLPIFFTINVITPIVFDVDLICAIQFIEALNDKVVLWNRYVLDSVENVCCLKNLLEIYIHILKTYDVYKCNYQVLVSSSISFYLIHIVLYYSNKTFLIIFRFCTTLLETSSIPYLMWKC